jgi:hypothetical protein
MKLGLYAAVAQTGRAPDSMKVEGEAEDRVVAGSSPARGTTELSFGKNLHEECARVHFCEELNDFYLRNSVGHDLNTNHLFIKKFHTNATRIPMPHAHVISLKIHQSNGIPRNVSI